MAGSIVEPVPNESSVPGITWSVIIAGGLTAAAATLLLLLLGIGLGFSAVSPWANFGGSATTVGTGAIIWLIITQWLSAGLGGYLTGRLRTKWVNVHTHEVFFRDTAHGFLSWALATVVSAAILASVTSSIVSGTTGAATTIMLGAVQGVGKAAPEQVSVLGDPIGYYTDMFFRSDKPQAAPQDVRAETGRIVARSLAEGDLNPADRTQLARLISLQTGLSQPDAEKRVDDVVAQAKAAAEKAKQAADTARAEAATVALFSFLSLLIGAFIACVAAAFGGHERDEIAESLLVSDDSERVPYSTKRG